MSDRKNVVLGDTLHFDFNTRQADGTPITLAGTPSLAAYVDGGTTEITAGLTLTVDLDSKTGLHHVAAVLSAGNGYAVGDQGSIVLAAGTVDGISVAGTVLADFEIVPDVGVDADGHVSANLKKVDDDATAAANMESDYDGTGYAKSNSSIGVTGSVNNGVTLAADALTAAAIAADAITAIQAGLATAADLQTVDTVVDGIASAVTGLASTVSGLNNLSAAEVAQEIADALNTDNTTPPTAPPAADAPLGAKIGWLFALAAQKLEQTATKQSVYNAAGDTVIGEATVSDDGTTATRGAFAAPEE